MRWPSACVAAGLLLAVAAVYAQVQGHAFLHFDDDEAITANVGLEQGLSLAGLGWAFRTLLVANWIPVTVLSLLLDQELHGLSPRAMLLENAALHALASVLLFHAFRRMTGALWRSAAVAAVFALHPLHVESVAWAALRKDVLSGVFFALSLVAYVRLVERSSVARHAALAVACALGLLSKPTLVTLPFVLLLLDLWPLGRLARADGSLDARALGRAALEKLPLFVLAAAAGIATTLAQRAAGAMVAAQSFPLADRVANAFVATFDYLRTSVWPSGLAPFYPAPVDGVPLASAVAAAAVTLAMTLLAFAQRRQRPWILVGWLWFLGMLLPTLGLVQVGSQARADRYTYLPLVGLSILPVWALGELAERRRALRPVVAAVGIAWIAALGIAAHRQTALWRDGVTLFQHTLRVTRENPLAYAHLSEELLAQERYAEAAESMRSALRLQPAYVEMKNNLAWILVTRPEVAPLDPGEPLRLAVAAVEATGGRSPAALQTLALAQARAGRFAEASRTAQRAAALARAMGDAAGAAMLDARAASLRDGRIDP